MNPRAFSVLASCLLLVPQQGRADDLQLTQITTSLLKGIEQTGKKRIAVVDFVDLDGNTSRLGKYIAEELSVELTQSAVGIEVVDRAHLAAILAEHKRKSDGLLDEATTKELGQLAGVDILVTGSLTDVGDSVRVVAKALSTSSARIVAASSGSIIKSSAIASLLAQTTPDVGTDGKPAKADRPVDAPYEVGDLSITMIGCERENGDKIMCAGHITNKAKSSKRIRFLPASHLVDDIGNESRSDVGYSQYQMTIVVGSERSQQFCCIDKVLEPDLPLGIWFIGTNLAPSSSAVSVILDTSEGTVVMKHLRLLTKK